MNIIWIGKLLVANLFMAFPIFPSFGKYQSESLWKMVLDSKESWRDVLL